MIKFFHSPGSCSDGILLLLQELHVEFETEIINLKKGMQHDPAFLAVNPKGKVPSLLLEDGSTLTEFQTIAYWLVATFKKSNLWPDALEKQAQTLEVLDFIVGSVHMRGFTFVKMPKKFQLDEKGTEDLRSFGRSEAEKGLKHLGSILGTSKYLFGNFGVADAALFYVLTWAEQEGIPHSNNLKKFLDRVRGRPAYQLAFSTQ
ncbi:MAG: glutathione S-transferase family protein [Planktomarina sp.]|nr:glutathione S-transferase family protein [Planktomarina sp.]